MRNLRNISYRRSEYGPSISSVCYDVATDDVLLTTGPSEDSHTIELYRVIASSGNISDKDSVKDEKPIASWEAPSPNPDLPVDRVVDSHYFGDTESLCIILAGGDIVTVQSASSSNAPDEAHVEIVGSIDAGIAAARWSPEEELLILVTQADTVIFMSRSFDPVAEYTLTEEDLAASKHVSVGWGKKETQFHGKGAKAKGGLRDPTIPERVDQGTLSEHDDKTTSVTWRGDGAYVAINSIVSGSRRVVRVFARDGTLDSASEPVDGLEAALSWRPEGNLIAGVQRLPERVDVVFFERNGLRHGQFPLRLTQSQLDRGTQIRLEWNSASTVLAVIIDDIVQLWTTGNYHWYLKQELRLRSPCFGVSWHPQKLLQLAICENDHLVQLEYALACNRGSTILPHDYGVVAVVDGDTVKISPFRNANIPPPMALYEIQTPSPAIDVAFGPQNQAIAVLHHEGVSLFSWPMKDGRLLKPELSRIQGFANNRSEAHQICFQQHGDDLAFCVLQSDQVQTVLFPSRSDSMTALPRQMSGSPFRSLHGSPQTSKAYGQTSDGALFDLNTDQVISTSSRAPVYLPWLDIVGEADDELVIGLSRSGHLYANDRLLARNCSSFVTTSDHLIFTTSNHFLKFVHLTTLEDLEIPQDDPEKDERCRSIERGARIVTAIPATLSVILQMPRGNLETIYPRAMVLAGIRKSIDIEAYGKAFLHCRTHRVDMNILCDYKPAQFMTSIDRFLEQLRDSTYIDLFLSSLRIEDVTKTMYKDTKPEPAKSGEFVDPATESAWAAKPSEKVNIICDAILEVLLHKKNSNLQNIITAHVCKTPPALDDGLKLVADLMQEDEDLAERAVEHVCFLQDINKLYDHALGMYDLGLTLLIAQQSQRDPKEYVPFIKGLDELPELRRKFTIDDHLNRREKALQHLHTLGVFEEVKKYMLRHGLYTAALSLYRYDHEHHAILLNLYAEHLESTSKFRDAGLAFETLSNYPKATVCYRAAGASSWRECLSSAQQYMTKPSSSFDELSTALADALWEAKDYNSAATIHLQYLDSIEGAVKCLCKGYLFADALRLVLLNQRADLIETAVDAGLVDALSSTTDLLAECKAQLRAQVPRIAELRRKATEDPLGFYEGDVRLGGGADIPDDISIAASSQLSTSTSLFTRYTGKSGSVGTLGSNVSRASSKNRKREEKKRARGRKGTVYEEEYLVNSVRRLVERVEREKGDVERLVFALVRRGMVERARAVEGLMVEVVMGCEVAVGEVFGAQNEMKGGGGEAMAQGGGDAWVADVDGMLRESVDAARRVREAPPVVTAFQKLTLLE